MIRIPFESVDTPLTAIDYICAMRQCTSPAEVKQFCALIPRRIWNDARFQRAASARVEEFVTQDRA